MYTARETVSWAERLGLAPHSALGWQRLLVYRAERAVVATPELGQAVSR